MPTVLTSTHYPRGIAKVGFSTDLPTDYYGRWTRYGYELSLDGYGQIRGPGSDDNGYYDDEASAAFDAQDHAASLAEEAAEAKATSAEAEADYAATAYAKQMDALFALVNAQGGHVATDDIAGQAANRAINDVLAFIEAKAA